jgi:hypothetical protein
LALTDPSDPERHEKRKDDECNPTREINPAPMWQHDHEDADQGGKAPQES